MAQGELVSEDQPFAASEVTVRYRDYKDVIKGRKYEKYKSQRRKTDTKEALV